jgi:molybdopterin/thiamine biosynthesis adenylyltransferase
VSGSFTDEQIRRYSRQIILPEVGGKGQKKLMASRVLVLGAGGLGSSAIAYLAAAGIGTLGIVDNDIVEISNLQSRSSTAAVSASPKRNQPRALFGASTAMWMS